MALLKIVKAGAPILKETAAPVKTITKNTKRLLNDMAKPCMKQKRRAGSSADWQISADDCPR